MDRIQQLEAFVRVAETGSFTRAAELLGLPRSTVSTLVQALEARLGVRLLDRTTRRVALTADGESYYARAARLLTDFEEAEAPFLEEEAPIRGRLRVDAPARIARLILAPALPGFFTRHPEIELELGSTDRAVDLIQEGVDCVLRVGGSSDPLLIVEPLGLLTQLNCASPGYLARYGVPQRIEDLSSHFAVHYASPATGALDEWEYVDAQGRARRVPMRALVTVNNAETYLACCLADMGLIQVPAYDAQQDLRAGRLVEVLPQWRAAPMQIALMYPRRRHGSRRLHAFIDWLREVLVEPLGLGRDGKG